MSPPGPSWDGFCQPARRHRDNPVGSSSGLVGVVSHPQGCHSKFSPGAGEFLPDGGPEWGVEMRKRLVEQKHRRAADDRPAQRHPLTLAPRELVRATAQEPG